MGPLWEWQDYIPALIVIAAIGLVIGLAVGGYA